MKSKIDQFLGELGIEVVKYEHPPFFTCAESEEYCRENLPAMLKGKNKNLFLRNKKKDQFYLVSVCADKRVDLNELRRKFEESKLSFGGEEDMMKFLGLKPGSVSPFALLHDKENHLKVFADKDLFEEELIYFHPAINTESWGIKPADFKKFLDNCGNSWQELEVPVKD
jgi:Ala-tRNA(Pro) deacylase